MHVLVCHTLYAGASCTTLYAQKQRQCAVTRRTQQLGKAIPRINKTGLVAAESGAAIVMLK